MTETMTASKSAITKSDFRSVFWRSFALMGSFNYERMQSLGFLYSILKPLKHIYADDEEGLKEACKRHIAAFNMTCAPSTFVMGISLAMEESYARDKELDTSSVNAIKVSLMGPLSGIGDTFLGHLPCAGVLSWRRVCPAG